MVRRLLRRIGERLRQLTGNKEHARSAPAHSSRPPSAPPAPARVQKKAERPPQAARPGEHKPRHPHHPPPPAARPAWDIASFQVPPKEGAVRFHDLHLPAEIMHGIADLGFQYCTPIQAAILPKTLSGLDAAGRAQTGTGKTAAFLITIFTHLLKNPAPRGAGQGDARRPGAPRALILAPTRELCLQIHKEAEEISRHARFRTIAVFGGMDYDKQRRALQSQLIDVMVATPGRLLDFKRQRCLHLDRVEILVIDEADRMLDMGFIPDVREIVHATPPKAQRQTMLWSATLTPEVTRLCAQWTRDPVIVEIERDQVAAESIEQIVYITTTADKFTLLYNILKKQADQPVLIFTNRRDQARDLVDELRAYGITCALLTGEVPQERRVKTLENFKTGRVKVLVATDVAGRGLHVEGISHVINYHLPEDPMDYVHRIGRTGRAGLTGISVSFASEHDAFFIPDIEKYLGEPLKCTYPEEGLLRPPPPPAHPRPP
ncbi:MAG: DEAD/DEAH box helicase, partial [Verrucomicrobiota bacterium]